MKQSIFLKSLIISFLVLVLVSCDRPKCKNTNPIFDEYQPNSEVYKRELAEQLKTVDSNQLSYWLKAYEEREGQTYLHFYIQGDGLCAVLVLTMQQWDKLEYLKKVKGKGYFNAEFVDLKFETKQDSLTTNFIYQTLDRIID